MKKKVLFFGDMNNILLTVAIGLSKTGLKVRYLPSLKINQHYRFYDLLIPGIDIKEIIEFENYDISIFKKDEVDKYKEKLIKFKNDGYIVVGTGLTPSVLEYCGINLDMFVVSGADLVNQTKENIFKSYLKTLVNIIKGKKNFLSLKKISNLQFNGILNSKLIVSHSSGYFKYAPKKLKFLEHKLAPYPINFSEEYNSISEEHFVENKQIQRLIDRERLNSNYLICLLSKIDPNKGSYVFIEGFYRYVKETNPSAVLLIPGRGRFKLVYEKSKKLKDLIYSKNIKIIPPLSQRGIYYLKSKCDVAFGINIGDYTKHDWNTTIMQTLQAQTPLISYTPFNTLCDIPNFELYPHYNSKNSEQVKNGLIKFSDEKNRLLEKTKIKNWNIYMHNKSIKIWTNIIDELC